ncbi:MAG: hypothetical protein QXJ97_03210 [Desulfurococcaceae archaeon]
MGNQVGSNSIREGAGEAPELTVFEVPKDAKVLPCRIDADFPIYNPKHTWFNVAVYTSLVVKKFKQPHLVTYKKTVSKEFAAPVGAIVRVEYSSGSGRHTYYTFTGYFLVAEVGEKELEVSVKDYNVGGVRTAKLKTRNLELLDTSGFSKAEVEAEVANEYNARLSKYDPVELLYYFWVKKKVAGPAVSSVSPAVAVTDLEEQIRKIEELIKQKEQELQALREQLQQLQLKLQLEKMKRVMVG